jgi:hypothetical protein
MPRARKRSITMKKMKPSRLKRKKKMSKRR